MSNFEGDAEKLERGHLRATETVVASRRSGWSLAINVQWGSRACSVWQRRAERQAISSLQCLKGNHKGDGAKLFSVVTNNLKRGNGHKFQLGLDSLGGQRSTGAGSYCCFPRETVKSPSSGLFKTHMDKATADLT